MATASPKDDQAKQGPPVVQPLQQTVPDQQEPAMATATPKQVQAGQTQHMQHAGPDQQEPALATAISSQQVLVEGTADMQEATPEEPQGTTTPAPPEERHTALEDGMPEESVLVNSSALV